MKFKKLRRFMLWFVVPAIFIIMFTGTRAYATGVTPGTLPEEGTVGAEGPDDPDLFQCPLGADQRDLLLGRILAGLHKVS